VFSRQTPNIDEFLAISPSKSDCRLASHAARQRTQGWSTASLQGNSKHRLRASVAWHKAGQWPHLAFAKKSKLTYKHQACCRCSFGRCQKFKIDISVAHSSAVAAQFAFTKSSKLVSVMVPLNIWPSPKIQN